MRAKIKIYYDEIMHAGTSFAKSEIWGIVYSRLVKQERIDTDFYYIHMKNFQAFTLEDIWSERSKAVYVDYELERRPEWDDLKECEERLEIGL